MIMPADPAVGDVYRPENIPGLVFEEVIVREVDVGLDGPLGELDGGLVVNELHQDGATEEKTFAPGYGEFLTAADGGDIEALALGIQTDAADTSAPGELDQVTAQSLIAVDATRAKDWATASAAIEQIKTAWDAYPTDQIPRMLEPLVTDTIDRLERSVSDQAPDDAGQSAIDLARLALDLQLRHRSAVEIDHARFDLWLAQMLLDGQAEDGAAVNGDFFALDMVRDRIAASWDESSATAINTFMEELIGAVGEADFEAVAEVATALREEVNPL
jgi:hypothetical protein